MSRYDSDPRVEAQGDGFTVRKDGQNFRVLPNEAMGWGIFTGPNLDLIGIGYSEADAAIAWLIGEPQ